MALRRLMVPMIMVIIADWNGVRGQCTLVREDERVTVQYCETDSGTGYNMIVPKSCGSVTSYGNGVQIKVNCNLNPSNCITDCDCPAGKKWNQFIRKCESKYILHNGYYWQKTTVGEWYYFANGRWNRYIEP